MARPYSTKRPKPIPAEFADFFVRHGWQRCNLTFGKRETLRYYRALGAEKLSTARQAVVERARSGSKQAAA